MGLQRLTLLRLYLLSFPFGDMYSDLYCEDSLRTYNIGNSGIKPFSSDREGDCDYREVADTPQTGLVASPIRSRSIDPSRPPDLIFVLSLENKLHAVQKNRSIYTM